MINYLDDLESDLSRFHRIDDIYQLDGPKFMRLAWRISAYGGVMSMRIRAQNDNSGPGPSQVEPVAPRANGHQPAKSGDVTWVSPATFAMMHGTGGG